MGIEGSRVQLMTGQAAFGEDSGTLHPPTDLHPSPLPFQSSPSETLFGEEAKRFPVVWLVDDEQANRDWFAHHHRDHYMVVTFSHRSHALRALREAALPCACVVTDIFFPARPVSCDEEATKLLSLYEAIEQTPVGALRALWNAERHRWNLDGLKIACDVTRERPDIPCFLYSRKATLLLDVSDYFGMPQEFYRRSFWLPEKIAPTAPYERAAAAAKLQEARIASVLSMSV